MKNTPPRMPAWTNSAWPPGSCNARQASWPRMPRAAQAASSAATRRGSNMPAAATGVIKSMPSPPDTPLPARARAVNTTISTAQATRTCIRNAGLRSSAATRPSAHRARYSSEVRRKASGSSTSNMPSAAPNNKAPTSPKLIRLRYMFSVVIARQSSAWRIRPPPVRMPINGGRGRAADARCSGRRYRLERRLHPRWQAPAADARRNGCSAPSFRSAAAWNRGQVRDAGQAAA